MAPSKYNATITLDNEAPHRGDVVVATVVTDAPATGAEMHCFDGDTLLARSDWNSHPAGEYTEDFGLQSGIWPVGVGGTCVISVTRYQNRRRVEVGEPIEFEVLP